MAVVVEVPRLLSEVVVEDLDHAIQEALAEGPRGVVCDLSAVVDGAEPRAVAILATAGRNVRDWPGTPVAVACPDPQVREELRAHPLGEYLIVTDSMFSAISLVLSRPVLAVESLLLAAQPTASRASRDFVTRALQHWGLSRVVPFANLVVSELVASSNIKGGSDIEVSVIWNREALRLAVRSDQSGPDRRASVLGLHERGLTIVAGISRAFGVLPTADGGKLVWAVLKAPERGHSRSSAVGSSKPQVGRKPGIATAI